jgi:ferredoxin--NADP+ reductase
MVDGTGMCGGCRVSVGGETRFACVDGPEFDAHQVDFDLLARRNRAYLAFEKDRLEEFQHAEPCKLKAEVDRLKTAEPATSRENRVAGKMEE